MAKVQENLPVKTEAAPLPAYMTSGEKINFSSNLGLDDITIPQVVLLQGLSPEVMELFPGVAKAGEFWHNGENRSLGTSFEFFVASVAMRYTLWAPRNDDRTILARADDGIHWDPSDASFEVKLKNVPKPVIWKTAPTVEMSGLHKFGTSNPADPKSPPAASLSYDYAIWMPQFADMGVSIFRMARTKLGPAKKNLNTILNNDFPMACRMEVSSFQDTNDNGEKYFNVKFRRAGMANDAEFEVMRRFAIKFSDLAKYKAKGEERERNEGGGMAASDGPREAPTKRDGAKF